MNNWLLQMINDERRLDNYLTSHRAYDLVLEDYIGENAMEVLTLVLQWEKIRKMEIIDTIENVYRNREYEERYSFQSLFSSYNLSSCNLNDIEDLMSRHGIIIA